VQNWLREQQELADLSSNSTLVIAEGSSHMIPEDSPDSVVDAILQVLEMIESQ